VGDRGFKGLGISLREFRNIKLVRGSDERNAFLFTEAGVPVSLLLNFTGRNGYSGIEPLAGIPGTFGGAVYMNAGSFGTEIKDVIVSVALMNREGDIRILRKDEILFSYRSSNISDDMIIMSANIMLIKDDAEAVGRRIRKYLSRKRESQPIGEASAGCVFKNPVKVGQKSSADTAGSLIERAGCKGMRTGDVEVSAVHANFFINRGKATCREFIQLMDTVRSKVEQFSGVRLEPELKIIGEI
jgi:UDP-N-acetylmuramate dehydrogenase